MYQYWGVLVMVVVGVKPELLVPEVCMFWPEGVTPATEIL